MGAFKSYEIIVCCLIIRLTLQERFETSLMGGGARSKRASALMLL